MDSHCLTSFVCGGASLSMCWGRGLIVASFSGLLARLAVIGSKAEQCLVLCDRVMVDH